MIINTTLLTESIDITLLTELMFVALFFLNYFYKYVAPNGANVYGNM